MMKFPEVPLGMVRAAFVLGQVPPPSAGILLGESGSDVFQIKPPLRNNRSSFCEGVGFTQTAKRLSMTIGLPLLLLIFMES